MSLFHNSHIRKTRCNISIQSMLFSSKLPLSFRTSNQQCKRISLLSHACHLPHPPQPLSLNHSDIQRDLGDKTIKHLIMQFCLPPLTFSPFSQVLPSAFLSYWLKYLEKGNDNNIRNCWSFAFHLSAAKALYTQNFFFACSYKCNRTWLLFACIYNRNDTGVGWSKIHPTQYQAV